MAYGIVVWLYDHLNYKDFENESSLRSAALAKDKTGCIAGWMNTSKDWVHDTYNPKAKWEHGHTKQQTTLRQGIDEYNEKIVKTEIAGAKSKVDLDRISMKEIESTGIKSDLQTLIDEKAKEFKQEGIDFVKGAVDDIKRDINKSKSLDELEKIKISDVRSEYGSDAAREISALKTEKRDELWEAATARAETLAEQARDDALSEIRSADTADRLSGLDDRIDNIGNLTGEFRDQLHREIRNRMAGLPE